MLNLSNKFSTYSTIIALLFVHFAQILADSSAENSTIHYNESAILPAAFLCSDGKGPLLEGEERIFPCDGQCPAGFECESVKGVNDGSGICCPNLEELYNIGETNSTTFILCDIAKEEVWPKNASVGTDKTQRIWENGAIVKMANSTTTTTTAMMMTSRMMIMELKMVNSLHFCKPSSLLDLATSNRNSNLSRQR